MKDLFRLITLRARKAALAVAIVLATVAGAIAPAAHAVSLTDTLESALVNHLFRGTAYTAPATWHVALLTSACSDSTTGNEVSAGGYARVGVASNTTNWAAVSAGNGTTSNTAIIAYATPTASWGTVTHFALYDAATAGNQLVCSPLTASRTINIGDTVRFPAGSLTVQIDN